jgi:hypothetical protein
MHVVLGLGSETNCLTGEEMSQDHELIYLPLSLCLSVTTQYSHLL